MKNAMLLWTMCSAVLLLPALAWADPPPDQFSIDFAGDAAIWNPFDGFEACESVLGATLCVSLTDVVCDGKGTCDGDVTWDFSGQLGGVLTGQFTSKAKCKAPRPGQDKPVCKAQIKDCGGVGQVEGFDTTIESCSIKGPVDLGGLYDGWGRARVCIDDVVQVGRTTCDSVSGAFQYDVNPPLPWTLDVDISTDAKGKIAGTASDDLGFAYEVKGSYKDSKDAAKLSLKGADDASNGAKIAIKDLTFTGATVTGGAAKVKVQGNQSQVEVD